MGSSAGTRASPLLFSAKRAAGDLSRQKEFFRNGRLGVVSQELTMQPGACVSPVPVGRRRGNAQSCGGIGECQASEVAELDQLTRQAVQRYEPLERLVQGEQLIGR